MEFSTMIHLNLMLLSAVLVLPSYSQMHSSLPSNVQGCDPGAHQDPAMVNPSSGGSSGQQPPDDDNYFTYIETDGTKTTMNKAEFIRLHGYCEKLELVH
ncbi:hypothetical protein BVRB_030730, partial [Beta vulgaris subsp. vulgaris]